MSKWKIWLISLALILMVGFVIVWVVNRPSENLSPPDTTCTVLLEEVQENEQEETLKINGTITPYEKAVVTARAAGIVQKITVENGTVVQAGQTLVTLDDDAYQTAVEVQQGILSQAETRLSMLKADQARIETLYDSGAVSEKDFQDIQAAVKIAEADYANARAALSNAQRDLQYTTITAPISGWAANRNVNLGQMLSIGYPLMEVNNISTVYVDVQLKAEELVLVQPGMAARVVLSALGDKSFPGAVAVVNPSANPGSRVYTARIKVDNPDYVLKPGMFAQVFINTGKSEKILLIPQKALSSREGEYYVFIPESGKAKLQAVQIGEVIKEQVEIKQGLKAGQQVVVSNVNKLKDQDLIIIDGQQEE